jgi:hypothetical protein
MRKAAKGVVAVIKGGTGLEGAQTDVRAATPDKVPHMEKIEILV